MGPLRLGKRLEPFCKFSESLVPSRFGHARVHLRVLVGFTFDCRLQIGFGIADRHPGCRIPDLFQEIKVSKRVARFCLRRIPEQASNIRKPLNVRPPGEIEVAPISLGLAGKCTLEIVVALGPF